jgi:VanZ family protein
MRPITGITIVGIRLGVIVLAAYWLLLFTGTHWPSGLEGVPDVNDKVKHFAGFFVLTGLLCYVTQSPNPNFWATTRRFSLIMLAVLIYAGIDEFTQRFSPGRTPDVWDFVADAAGAVAAVSLYAVARSLLAPVVIPALHQNSDRAASEK